MKQIFEEYSLMGITLVAGIIVLTIIINVFYGPDSAMAGVVESYAEGVIR